MSLVNVSEDKSYKLDVRETYVQLVKYMDGLRESWHHF